jgi:hypothetical protein
MAVPDMLSISRAISREARISAIFRSAKLPGGNASLSGNGRTVSGCERSGRVWHGNCLSLFR